MFKQLSQNKIGGGPLAAALPGMQQSSSSGRLNQTQPYQAKTHMIDISNIAGSPKASSSALQNAQSNLANHAAILKQQ